MSPPGPTGKYGLGEMRNQTFAVAGGDGQSRGRARRGGGGACGAVGVLRGGNGCNAQRKARGADDQFVAQSGIKLYGLQTTRTLCRPGGAAKRPDEWNSISPAAEVAASTDAKIDRARVLGLDVNEDVSRIHGGGPEGRPCYRRCTQVS